MALSLMAPEYEFFAGKMDYRRLALAPRLIVKRMKVPEGDFRSWYAVGAWADTLRNEMATPDHPACLRSVSSRSTPLRRALTGAASPAAPWRGRDTRVTRCYSAAIRAG